MAGLATVFGSGAMTNDIAGIVDNKALFVIGSNTTETHPIIGLRMKEAARRGAKIIVADPRRIPLVDHAALWLRHRPGTDAALINGLCHVIIRDGLADEAFIAERTENYEAFAAGVEACTPEETERITGVPSADIERAARMYAEAERAGIYYTMGITQHTSGTNNVLSLANLAMLTGNLGKHGAGLNPLRGQNNVQGSSDMACNPAVLPGYQKVDDPRARARFEELWGVKLPGKVGLTATEMTRAMHDGKIAGLWIMGENPVLSDPNAGHFKEAVKNLELLVVQDIFLTETAEMADVVLPAASFAEKEGTFTNTERRVQRVRRAVPPPGEARDDLSIIHLISARMQHGHFVDQHPVFRDFRRNNLCGFKTALPQPREVYEEIGRVWPAVAGITYERLDECGGLQWPCPDAEHAGTPFLFAESFPRGKGMFSVVEWQPSSELPDDEYPFLLTTGRVLQQYHTGTMTRRSRLIEAADMGPHVEIHPDDAEKLGVDNGAAVVASSRRGEIVLPALVTDRVAKGTVFMPFHYREAAVNLLTNDALDPVCKIPEAKVCAVRLAPAPADLDR